MFVSGAGGEIAAVPGGGGDGGWRAVDQADDLGVAGDPQGEFDHQFACYQQAVTFLMPHPACRVRGRLVEVGCQFLRPAVP